MIPIREASEKTGVSYETIRRLCLMKKIVFIRVGSKGGKYLINYQKFVEYLERGEMDD